MIRPGRPSVRLTGRELEIARLVREDLSNKEIASALGISEQTVKNHLTKVTRALSVATRAGVAVWVDRLDRGQWTGCVPF